MRVTKKPSPQNSLLSGLSDPAFERLESKLTQVWLTAETRLATPGKRPEFVYFPESGGISVLTCGQDGRSVHIGFYGYEGVGSVAIVLGASHSSFLEVVQFGGNAQRIATRDLEEIMSSCPGLRSLLLSYAHVLMTQIGDTALANGSLRIDQRLARWLLMIQDRLRTSTLAVTHQRLSELLSVRRSGVTDAIHILEENNLIRARRGMIDILDKRNLRTLAAGCYGKAEAAYERLIMPPRIDEHGMPDQDPA
jgi:CRP-like cAMP-binding protein